MKYSIIIPIYNPDNSLKDMICNAIWSIMITTVGKDIEIIPVIHNNLSYSQAVNIGLHRASGDYFVISSTDIICRDNDWLDKFSSEINKISSRRSIPFFMNGDLTPDACIWGMSRETYNKIGDLDEIYKDGYGFEDNDYWLRAKELNIEFNYTSSNIEHLENKTFSTYFKDKKQEMTSKNQSIFAQKWGKKLNL